jgi:hypothetical protein
VSDDCCEGAEEEPWNNLAISALPGFVGAAADKDVTSVEDDDVILEDVEVDEETGRAWSFEGPAVETEAGGLPLTWVDGVAGTDPKDFTLSVLTTGVAAGEDDKGGEASSMEPKVTTEPCLTEPTLLRGTLTPESFIGTPWPNALGRRE